MSHVSVLLLHAAYQGPPSGYRLEAPGVAASAGDSGGGRNLGVPEFARGADRSALERAAGDDARTQAGRCLDQQHVVEVVALTAPLGEHDDVGVVAASWRHFLRWFRSGLIPESGLSEAVSSPLTSISASLLAETALA